MDVSRINQLGWKHEVSLQKGIQRTYRWCLKNNEVFFV